MTERLHDFRFSVFVVLLKVAMRICPNPERANLLKHFREQGDLRDFIRANIPDDVKEFELTLTYEVRE